VNVAVSSAPFSSSSCGASSGKVSYRLCILFVFFFVMSLALNPIVSVNSTRMSWLDVEGYALAKDSLIA
jgi:hypothetical protein